MFEFKMPRRNHGRCKEPSKQAFELRRATGVATLQGYLSVRVWHWISALAHAC